MIIHHFPTVLILSVVLMAGFAAGGAVLGTVQDYFIKHNPPPPASALPLMFALIGVPNVLTILLFVKVWRSAEQWTLLGHRRRVWQILLVVTYGLGLSGGIAMLL